MYGLVWINLLLTRLRDFQNTLCGYILSKVLSKTKYILYCTVYMNWRPNVENVCHTKKIKLLHLTTYVVSTILFLHLNKYISLLLFYTKTEKGKMGEVISSPCIGWSGGWYSVLPELAGVEMVINPP